MDEAWFLESVAADGSHLMQDIRRLPFCIGRDADNDLVVEALGLSRKHARIDLDAAGRLRVTDLGSTNGTFVNRQRIDGTSALSINDVLHFGDAEYRLGLQTVTMIRVAATRPADESERTLIVPPDRSRSAHFKQHEREFRQVLAGVGLSAAVQPIVDAASGSVVAYELLGRCTHPLLAQPPIYLFDLAAKFDREAELSAAFRGYGVPAIAPRLNGARLFVNAHPKETFSESFFAELARWRALPDAPRLVVEVHETAVVDVAQMRELAARLKAIGVAFAYDDFGAGQARLIELGDAPADFVKFDMGLLHHIHEASGHKQRVVRDLVRMVLDFGSVPLAEGIELDAEAAVCREMGFQLVQGYLTGRPVAIDTV